ncbi:hypothetical protein [Brevibacillus parabrevis]|uniref:Uncharacterized protein n=1 Tax=Brevibacillus parabrevis TaxID=54914 RepID=A0A4Y3PQV0_BREPA|nr:hypothetical protein [Brevibacillus parabrevis]RNB94433.1 hypothetical protein EDM60_18775 [Brevibacillus parabrevis]GEB35305.1 hypothetical protein BPA01_48850 [Brevibacillus parabrevis]
MTPVLLMHSLKTFLEEVVVDVELTNPKGTLTTPQVFLEALPQRKADSQEEDYPFIIVRAAGGEDLEDGSTASLNLIVGTYSKDDSGFIDVLNIIEDVRQALLKKRVVGQSFRMELPLKWKLFDEQPYPGWVGEMNTLWTIPQVQEEVFFG